VAADAVAIAAASAAADVAVTNISVFLIFNKRTMRYPCGALVFFILSVFHVVKLFS